MNESFYKAARKGRHLALKCVEPLDGAYNKLLHKNVPPLSLRQKVGSISTFEGASAEYVAYLKLLCGLKPPCNILDIGCGCGSTAQSFTGQYALCDVNRYAGLDVHLPFVQWCNDHLKGYYFHIDVYDEELNPQGSKYARDYEFGLPSNLYDIVLFKSIFTHMFLEETLNYLSQMKVFLKPDGACLATFFLLNDEQRELQSYNHYHFNHKIGTTWHVRKSKPRLAVAYEQDELLEALHGLGLNATVHKGQWSGCVDGLSFQDILILRRQG